MTMPIFICSTFNLNAISKGTYSDSFSLDHTFKGIGIGRQILDKQIPGKLEQMLLD